MNFKQFLIEETREEILSNIKRDCPKFLHESSGYHLYRGIKNRDSDFYRLQVRQDRYPRNSSTKFHEHFNEAYYEVYGVENIRSKALFTTGNKNDADFYSNAGPAYIIYPILEYEFWWSPKIVDVFSEFGDYLAKNGISANNPHWKGEKVIKYEWVRDFVKWGEYQNTDLVKAIKSLNEIMVLCKEYYALRSDVDWDEELENLAKSIQV